MNSKKILVVVLFLLTLFFIFACGTPDEPTEQASPVNTGGEDIDEPAEAANDRFTRVDPELPEMDFKGHNFNIVHWYVGVWGFDDCDDIVVEELTGEVFSDAVFNRNKAVEDKYNVNINLIRMDINDITTNVGKMIRAGDDSYDLVYQRLHEAMNLLMNGSFSNLNEIDYIDFNKPWWDKRSVDDFSLGGKVYMAASDISTKSQEAIGCILFNKKLAQDYALDNLYDIVARGEWTLDYVVEICKNKARDLNGDGILNETDFIPFAGEDLLTTVLFNGAGSRFAEKDEHDMPVCNFMNERNLSICQKILDFMYNSEIYINNPSKDMFKEGQSIFRMAQMLSVRKFREMETDFGILPSPKYDDNQTEYYSCLSIHQAGLVSVPTTATDFDRTGIILEALSAESRYTVQPAYYDISLKGKFVRDEESADMLDILFDTRIYDLGSVGHFGQFETEWLRIVSNNNRDIVSLYEKSEKRIQSDIDKLIKAIDKLD